MERVYTTGEKKHLLDKISKLSKTEHEEIFKIIKEFVNDTIPITQNKNGIFINFSSLSNDVIDKINHFVEFCNRNKLELDQYDKMMNECKINNSVHMMVATPSTISQPLNLMLNKSTKGIVENWQEIIQEKKEQDKITNFIGILEDNIDRMSKKKTHSKYANAKKRFARKIIQDKKIEIELNNILEIESYLV